MKIKNLFSKKKTQFKFVEDENKAVFTCNHVLDDGHQILFVSHDGEGDWQFLCGINNHLEKNARVISLKQAVDLDETINDLFEMPLGIGAERKGVGEKWIPFKVE